MSELPEPTEPQLKWLRRANKLGVIDPPYGHGGLVKANWEKLMLRMVKAGLVTANPHGGYDLTNRGRSFVPPA